MPWRARTRRRRNGASKALDWPTALGRKVSVRFRLHDDPAHPFSEAIGVIQAVAERDGVQYVEILNRRGEVISIAVRDVLAAKLFPLDQAH